MNLPDLMGRQISTYLGIAKQIHEHMTYGWDDVCGGIHWQHCDTYIASISVELYLLLSTKLHQYTGDDKYLNIARTVLDWFVRSGIINQLSVVTGGKYTASNCTNDNGPGFTYNQGVLLPALVYLNDTDRAVAIIKAVLDSTNNLVIDGILTDHNCEIDNSCDEDQKMFKGVYIQFLKDWYLATKPNYISASIKDFVTANINTIFSLQRNYMFPLAWARNSNPSIVDYYTTTSAITALVSSLFMD